MLNITFITLTEAARIAGKDASTLRRAIANERLLGQKIGKTWVTDREALAVWLKSDVHKPGRKARK